MILYSKGAIIGFSGFIGSNLLKQYKKKIKKVNINSLEFCIRFFYQNNI